MGTGESAPVSSGAPPPRAGQGEGEMMIAPSSSILYFGTAIEQVCAWERPGTPKEQLGPPMLVDAILASVAVKSPNEQAQRRPNLLEDFKCNIEMLASEAFQSGDRQGWGESLMEALQDWDLTHVEAWIIIREYFSALPSPGMLSEEFAKKLFQLQQKADQMQAGHHQERCEELMKVFEEHYAAHPVESVTLRFLVATPAFQAASKGILKKITEGLQKPGPTSPLYDLTPTFEIVRANLAIVGMSSTEGSSVAPSQERAPTAVEARGETMKASSSVAVTGTMAPPEDSSSDEDEDSGAEDNKKLAQAFQQQQNGDKDEQRTSNHSSKVATPAAASTPTTLSLGPGGTVADKKTLGAGNVVQVKSTAGGPSSRTPVMGGTPVVSALGSKAPTPVPGSTAHTPTESSIKSASSAPPPPAAPVPNPQSTTTPEQTSSPSRQPNPAAEALDKAKEALEQRRAARKAVEDEKKAKEEAERAAQGERSQQAIQSAEERLKGAQLAFQATALKDDDAAVAINVAGDQAGGTATPVSNPFSAPDETADHPPPVASAPPAALLPGGPQVESRAEQQSNLQILDALSQLTQTVMTLQEQVKGVMDGQRDLRTQVADIKTEMLHSIPPLQSATAAIAKEHQLVGEELLETQSLVKIESERTTSLRKDLEGATMSALSAKQATEDAQLRWITLERSQLEAKQIINSLRDQVTLGNREISRVRQENDATKVEIALLQKRFNSRGREFM